jgi:hypothetical protein
MSPLVEGAGEAGEEAGNAAGRRFHGALLEWADQITDPEKWRLELDEVYGKGVFKEIGDGADGATRKILAMQKAAKEAANDAAADAPKWVDALSTAYDRFETVANAGMSAWSAFDNMLQGFEQRRIDALNEQMNMQRRQSELKILQLEAEGATEGEIARTKLDNAQQEYITEQKTQEKIANLQRKQARRQKAIDIANATMGTASAVVAALGAKPWTPANYALAAAVGGLGAAQIAAISATPIPAYANGADFMTSGPQMIMVGDNASGRERVRIDPQPDNRGSGGAAVINNFFINGAVGGRDELISWIYDGLRQAQQTGVIGSLVA